MLACLKAMLAAAALGHRKPVRHLRSLSIFMLIWNNPFLSFMADAVVYTDSNDLISNLLLFSIWDVWMP
jgi:hypothetical protein